MRKVTTLGLICLVVVGFANLTWAQEREDVIWARFTDDEITLDGELDEAAWSEAATVDLTYGVHAGLPGSGWWIENQANTELDGPTDPMEATFRFLAKGDTLYMAVTVADSSIGGATGLWSVDEVFFPIRNLTAYGPTEDGLAHFPTQSAEMTIGWWNPHDTTDTGLPAPGADPQFNTWIGDWGWGIGGDSARTAEQVTNFDYGYTVDGTVNEDTHGEDVGYTFEMKMNVAVLGYDLDDPMGETVEMSFGVQDADWRWPSDPNLDFTTRTWFQSQWFNGVHWGTAKVMTDPTVTTESGAAPDAAADVIVPNAVDFEAPTVDGQLDEEVWTESSVAVSLQYGNEDLFDTYPGQTKYNSGYWSPNVSAEVPAVDASQSDFKWFFKDNWLYIGVDVDDQSVDSTLSEAGDGFAITINDRDSTDERSHNYLPRQFEVTIGPDGEARLGKYFLELDESAYEVAASLKEGTTVADPSDVDAGYQIEVAINLVDALHYPDGRGDGAIFISAHSFDSDIFEEAARNYNVRTWWSRERAQGLPAYGFLDPNTMVGTASEDLAELPGRVELDGNYPNPFNPSTTIRYALPAAGDVTIHVFDLLGREVTQLAAGTQAAGRQEVELNANTLASGVYFYRVALETAAGQAGVSPTGSMILVK